MPTIEICAALLLDPTGRMLLVRKQHTATFMQPGGKPEPGEDPRQTIARELAEELGLFLALERFDDLGTFEAQAANEPGHRVSGHAFHVRLTNVEAVSAKAAAEIAEACWVSASEASELPLAPLTKHYFVPLMEGGLRA